MIISPIRGGLRNPFIRRKPMGMRETVYEVVLYYRVMLDCVILAKFSLRTETN